MRDYVNDEHAIYSLVHEGKEYKFSIDRNGVGFCDCDTDARDAMLGEDKSMLLKSLLGDKKSRERELGIRGEFSVDVTLTKAIADAVWEGWDEVDTKKQETMKATPERLAREEQLDSLLLPIVKELFGFV